MLATSFDLQSYHQAILKHFRVGILSGSEHTGWFTTCGHYCRRWFLRSLW